MDEGVVEGSEDTGNAENKLALLKRSIRVPTLAPAVLTCLADLGSKLSNQVSFVASIVHVLDATNLDVLLRTALDLLLGRHVVCGLVGGGVDGDGGRSRFKKFALRLGNFVQRSVTGQLFRRSTSAPAELFLSLSLHVSSSFFSRHALTLQHLTAASIQVQSRHHGGQEEHRHHRYGRYGEDVCLALECGRLEVSAILVAWLPRCPGAWDSWVSLSSDFFFYTTSVVMTVSAFGSSVALACPVAVLVAGSRLVAANDVNSRYLIFTPLIFSNQLSSLHCAS